MSYYGDDGSVAEMSVVSIAVNESDTKESELYPSSGKASTSQITGESVIRRRNMEVMVTKIVFLVLLVSSGVALSVGAHTQIDQIDDESFADKAAIVVGCVFAGLVMMFLRYDYVVGSRQSMVVDMAAKSKAIVNQLFPSGVQQRMLQQDRPALTSASRHKDDSKDFSELTKANTEANKRVDEERPIPVNGFDRINASEGALLDSSSPPIADLYSASTVCFADIAGFTSWSSNRSPEQVFTLLETIYGAFDDIGETLGVFKVETIGDCYMAVTGVPDPDANHAVKMAKFAYQILKKMKSVMEDLEPVLGEGTCELDVRVGMHSGQVTAGVLRGRKGRFQLFGDTVNTASRMESTGRIGKIQVSQNTADLLIGAGKIHWLTVREDRVQAKGLGQLTTYWLDPKKKEKGVKQIVDITLFSERSTEDDLVEVMSPIQEEVRQSLLTDHRVVSSAARQLCESKYRALIDLNTDILLSHLVECVKWRQSGESGSRSVKKIDHSTEVCDMLLPYEMVADVIILPGYDRNRFEDSPSPASISKMRQMLHMFVTDIAVMYNGVSFHSFEHASHVVLAANQLLKSLCKQREGEDDLHFMSRSFGIGFDPVARFALVFSALCHDVGHSGVPNSQLVVEEAEVALEYKSKSVAEQNAFVLSWKLLLQKKYSHLRSKIYKTNVERKRFRQIVTNCIMATDIADRDTLMYRQRQWKKAFVVDQATSSNRTFENMSRDEINRKATVVLEMMIQVADVSHTMQDFAVYLKWNERLFNEMSLAYATGRGSFDPMSTWYNQELQFFDKFVIPLASRLKECQLFGPSFLRQAKENREEWAGHGKRLLGDMADTFQKGFLEQDGDDDSDEEASIMDEESSTSFAGDSPSVNSVPRVNFPNTLVAFAEATQPAEPGFFM